MFNQSPSEDPPLAGRSQTPRNVCIVTGDFNGISGDSDVAFACTGLAQALAAQGDSVTVVFTPPPGGAPIDGDEKWRKDWRDYYLINFLVNVEFLPASPDLPTIPYDVMHISLAAYHYLKHRRFDIVYFSLKNGAAYYSLLAKETGQYPDPPLLCVLAWQPFEWRKQADKQFVKDLYEMRVAFTERHCIAAADVLVSPSRMMLEWMRGRGWKLAERQTVLPILQPMHERLHSTASGSDDGAPHPISEIVFYGDTDYHRGLTLFGDLVDQLMKLGRANLKITLLGRFSWILGEHTGSYLLRRAERWPYEVSLQPRLKLHEQIGYLRVPGRLAVMPSLADDMPRAVISCLGHGIPFIATAVGGIPELIEEAGQKHCLVDPSAKSLAGKVAAMLDRPPPPARAAVTHAAAVAAWTEFQDGALAPVVAPRVLEGPDRPLVSIVMPHYNRPQLFRRALDSVRRQTYPGIEVVMVDDGSTLPEAHRMLEELTPEFARRGWKIIRQQNKHLGAARNAAIRRAAGDYIVFLDDDNVLFDDAVERLLTGIRRSGADICTCLSRLLFDSDVPAEQQQGKIWYLALGGSLDVAYIYDVFGDANAIFRRDVFDRIGYLVEDYGYACHDWEIFTRAVLKGLKLRLVPEPLYWYRSSPESMFRSSHWYDNHQPITALFKEHGFAGTEYLLDTVLANQVTDYDQKSFLQNLNYNPKHRPLQALAHHAADSDEALRILAGYAAGDGRTSTAIQLLSLLSPRQDIVAQFRNIIDTGAGRNPDADVWPAERTIMETVITQEELREASLAGAAASAGQTVGFIASDEAKLFLRALPDEAAAAILAMAIPPGALRVVCEVRHEQEIAVPTEFLLLASAPGEMARFGRLGAADALQTLIAAGAANSGWHRLDWSPLSLALEIVFATPAAEALDLTLAIRGHPNEFAEPACGSFSKIAIHRLIDEPVVRRPRLGLPLDYRPSWAPTNAELKAAVTLATPYDSPHQVLDFWETAGPGFLLRPRPRGITVAILRNFFPSFARRLIATVEVAEDRAPSVEFAMALIRQGKPIWTKEAPGEYVAFSGWLRVADKWTLHKMVLETPGALAEPLTIAVATRLPPGQPSHFNHAFWRKFVISWSASDAQARSLQNTGSSVTPSLDLTLTRMLSDREAGSRLEP